ncbi:di-trans,poly-cis-decaprenylcistransferase [bacterium (Candidatus Gribaldobacteria) CG23_combo_of_CG06-09_8_20_14_all_37_87_8]|uniref:Isoprenyl transferase n=1 Tax=bacterium (Candidatus Gribaldobacteria) CG23_combo_of_CG06-09_8_20_14_all_37_87_8 TaxID=2014278 RepID=A0A2G9ZDX4_9BACT|nr:MAG: di-trans,poly-cis-decaprenylcistransferase [bacterium (Candidatus Gribaldobacteria) CG23_combo_of_CG06-09_8_20_14_all_37_87_8]
MNKLTFNQKVLPYHIGFIVDGNRRWAKEKGLPTFMGHKKGAEQIEEIIKYAQDLGIKIVTIYAFSTENWKRTEKEVSYLMKLFEDFAVNKMDEANKREIKIKILGNFQGLPLSLQKVLNKAINLTKNNQKIIVNVALNYGGRDEITRTFRKLMVLGIKPKEITEKLINQNLDTAGLPDPDFIIRTSGEQRLSNFIPWQATYSELYFPKIHWPDFDKKQLDTAILEFQKRQRRHGQ